MGLFGRSPNKLETIKSALARQCMEELNVVDMTAGRKLTRKDVMDMEVNKERSETSAVSKDKGI